MKLLDADIANCKLDIRWRKSAELTRTREPAPIAKRFLGGTDLELELVAPADEGDYELEIFVINVGAKTAPPIAPLRVAVQVRSGQLAAFAPDAAPLSYAWGTDRGEPVHRFHLEQFLASHAPDIRGRCLEFQEPRYAPRFGGTAVKRLDILHADCSNPRATIVADLTAPNEIPGGSFDCIICTHVLHSIFHLERAIANLHHILASRGVLLIGVPHISMCDSRFEELWRFTVAGLRRLLSTAFAPDEIAVTAYGNSFTSAGELRGMVAAEFPQALLTSHDERFAAEICARAQKLR